MSDVFNTIATGNELRATDARELHERGFVVLPGPISASNIKRLSGAYDSIVALANADDVHTGSTTTRVSDVVNRGHAFDALYIFPPLLEACCHVIGRDFKLSSMHARTLRPHAAAQELHVDVPRDSADWPLIGFILMIDDFRTDNGATRFVPGTHHRSATPEEVMTDRRADCDGQVVASGPAGSLIIFNGSAWHGHTANTSHEPRRSVQGAFIPRDGHAATDFSARMRSETRARLSPLAQYVLMLLVGWYPTLRAADSKHRAPAVQRSLQQTGDSMVARCARVLYVRLPLNCDGWMSNGIIGVRCRTDIRSRSPSRRWSQLNSAQ